MAKADMFMSYITQTDKVYWTKNKIKYHISLHKFHKYYK